MFKRKKAPQHRPPVDIDVAAAELRQAFDIFKLKWEQAENCGLDIVIDGTYSDMSFTSLEGGYIIIQKTEVTRF